jgi:hypothetical protein
LVLAAEFDGSGTDVDLMEGAPVCLMNHHPPNAASAAARINNPMSNLAPSPRRSSLADCEETGCGSAIGASRRGGSGTVAGSSTETGVSNGGGDAGIADAKPGCWPLPMEGGTKRPCVW